MSRATLKRSLPRDLNVKRTVSKTCSLKKIEEKKRRTGTRGR